MATPAPIKAPAAAAAAPAASTPQFEDRLIQGDASKLPTGFTPENLYIRKEGDKTKTDYVAFKVVVENGENGNKQDIKVVYTANGELPNGNNEIHKVWNAKETKWEFKAPNPKFGVKKEPFYLPVTAAPRSNDVVVVHKSGLNLALTAEGAPFALTSALSNGEVVSSSQGSGPFGSSHLGWAARFDALYSVGDEHGTFAFGHSLAFGQLVGNSTEAPGSINILSIDILRGCWNTTGNARIGGVNTGWVGPLVCGGFGVGHAWGTAPVAGLQGKRNISGDAFQWSASIAPAGGWRLGKVDSHALLVYPEIGVQGAAFKGAVAALEGELDDNLRPVTEARDLNTLQLNTALKFVYQLRRSSVMCSEEGIKQVQVDIARLVDGERKKVSLQGPLKDGEKRSEIKDNPGMKNLYAQFTQDKAAFDAALKAAGGPDKAREALIKAKYESLRQEEEGKLIAAERERLTSDKDIIAGIPDEKLRAQTIQDQVTEFIHTVIPATIATVDNKLHAEAEAAYPQDFFLKAMQAPYAPTLKNIEVELDKAGVNCDRLKEIRASLQDEKERIKEAAGAVRTARLALEIIKADPAREAQLKLAQIRTPPILFRDDRKSPAAPSDKQLETLEAQLKAAYGMKPLPTTPQERMARVTEMVYGDKSKNVAPTLPIAKEIFEDLALVRGIGKMANTSKGDISKKARISDAGRAALSQMLQRLVGQLHAHASATGSRELNLKVAGNRGKAVMLILSYLIEDANKRFEIVDHGEEDLARTDLAKGLKTGRGRRIAIEAARLASRRVEYSLKGIESKGSSSDDVVEIEGGEIYAPAVPDRPGKKAAPGKVKKGGGEQVPTPPPAPPRARGVDAEGNPLKSK